MVSQQQQNFHIYTSQKFHATTVILKFEPISLIDKDDFKGEIYIFTDGSKFDQGVGYAYCCFRNNKLFHSQTFRLATQSSVYQEELLPIREALNWARHSAFSSSIILSDSFSSLQALRALDSTDSLVSEIQQALHSLPVNKLIFFSWLKGHSEVEGNEVADSLAKKAAQDDNLPLNFFSIPKFISKT